MQGNEGGPKSSATRAIGIPETRRKLLAHPGGSTRDGAGQTRNNAAECAGNAGGANPGVSSGCEASKSSFSEVGPGQPPGKPVGKGRLSHGEVSRPRPL